MPSLATLIVPIALCAASPLQCRERLRAPRAAGGRGAVAIGVSAPQGCGKTTMTNALLERFAAAGGEALEELGRLASLSVGEPLASRAGRGRERARAGGAGPAPGA